MGHADRLEELWMRLGQEIREGQADLEVRASALNAKREQFKKLDEARRLILLDAGTSNAGVKLLLEQLEAAPDVHTPIPLTQHESVRRYVCESRSIDGVTAMEVAQALRKLGYGGKTKWKNFYASVTVSLNRWSKRGALEKIALVSVWREACRFIRPHHGISAAAIEKNGAR